MLNRSIFSYEELPSVQVRIGPDVIKIMGSLNILSWTDLEYAV